MGEAEGGLRSTLQHDIAATRSILEQMMRHVLLVCWFVAAIPASASAQIPRRTATDCHLGGPEVLAAFTKFMKDTPPKEEISALLNKANQKVSDFEAVVNTLKSNLETTSPGVVKQDIDGATNAHVLISGLLAKGPNVQGLIGVLSILDDLSRSAFRESTLLLLGGGITPDIMSGVTALSSAGNALYDISELVFHTTFRAAGASEDLISHLITLMK